jgi:hypothetical protein
MEKFGQYSFPEIIDAVGNSTPNEARKIAQGLEGGDASLLVHMGRYFRRDVANALRGDARRIKQEYDSSGEQYKTPLALRDITDSQERKVVFANISHFGTTQGCSGGCKWCGVDAFSTNDIEVTPPQQVSHFFDEYVSHMSELRDDPAFIRSCMSYMGFYNDSDPFNDPNILQIMTELYKKTGGVPSLSTVIPRSGENAFMEYTAIARKHYDLKQLKDFSTIRVFLFRAGYTSVSEFLETEERFLKLEELRKLYSRIARLKHFPQFSKEESDLMNYYALAQHEGCKRDGPGVFLECIGQKIYDEEKALRFYPGKKIRYKVGRLIKAYDGFFERQSLGTLEKYYGPGSSEAMGTLREKIGKTEAELKDVPQFREIRVSLKPQRERFAVDLLGSKNHLFGIYDRSDKIRFAGKRFFDSGQSATSIAGGYGIVDCNGMELSPFMLANSVAGKITHDFPQGRVLVPYKGLSEESGVQAKRGDSLGAILPHIIVILDYWNYLSKPPNNIHVYDGRNIRRIRFSRRSYNVISDEVVKKDVDSLDDISRFNFRLREAKKISKGGTP